MKKHMTPELIFVTGYFGAPIGELAKEIATEKNYRLLSLDDEIEKSAGQSILRICMMMGEHEYRNKEYEVLSSIVSGGLHPDAEGIVVCCGDGVLHDEMSRELIEKHSVLIAGEGMSREELWENAKGESASYHAFMHFGSEESRKEAFDALHERQRSLYSPFKL